MAVPIDVPGVGRRTTEGADVARAAVRIGPTRITGVDQRRSEGQLQVPAERVGACDVEIGRIDGKVAVGSSEPNLGTGPDELSENSCKLRSIPCCSFLKAI